MNEPSIGLQAKLLEPQNRPNYMVAALAGMSPSRLSEYALGRRAIPPHHLIRLCEVLECQPDDILEPLDASIH